jgi:hypothetical protein
LADALALHDVVDDRLICFEQLLLAWLAVLGAEALALKVCAEPNADIAASICLRCASGGVKQDEVRAGLLSYIADARGRGGPILRQGDLASLGVA